MSKIEGVMLYRCRKEDIQEPMNLIEDIFRNLKNAYTKGSMINGDVSEYNILSDGERSWIIDWPQFVSLSHQNALEILKRDVENITKFFGKRFALRIDSAGVISYITDKTDEMPTHQT